MAKILVVEDEAKIARFVQLELMHEGYEVDIARDGKLGLEKILEQKPDLVVLDLMLPGLNGFEVCKSVRENGIDSPIIMLTARDDVSDKLSGFGVGADDYMTKPFAIEELIARIKIALVKYEKISKKDDAQEQNDDKKDSIIEYGDLKINRNMYTVHYKDDEINLTKKEFDLLVYLMENMDVAISRDNILNKVWEYDFYGNTNVVDVYVRYIRQKLDDVYGIHVISTVRGVGYMVKSLQ